MMKTSDRISRDRTVAIDQQDRQIKDVERTVDLAKKIQMTWGIDIDIVFILIGASLRRS